MNLETNNNLFFQSFDGKSIFYKEWIAKENATACIIAIHGLGSYAESFNNLGTFFQERNINVFAFDVRGFGRWKYENKWGYILFDNITKDIKCFIDKVVAPKRTCQHYFLLGDSIGCILATHYLRSNNGNWSGIIFASPFFLRPMLRILLYPLFLLKCIVPTMRIRILGNLRGLTLDTDYIDFDNRIGLGAKWFTLEFLCEMGRTVLRAEKYLLAIGIDYPLFVVSGEEDGIVRPQCLRSLVARIRGLSKNLKIYEAGHHLLINDLPRNLVFHDILNFIESTATRKNSINTGFSFENQLRPTLR